MILVMLSGGLDSTGVLYKLLTETEEKIHVHHISIRNKEKRWRPELRAANNVVGYCNKNIRPVSFSTNVFEFMQFNNFFAWDNDVVRFVAAQVAKNDKNIHSVALGKCAHDDDPSFKLRAIQSRALWHACFFDITWQTPQIIRPVEDMRKKEIAEMLPERLYNFTWSCRTPIFRGVENDQGVWDRCNGCKTCKQLKEEGL